MVQFCTSKQNEPVKTLICILYTYVKYSQMVCFRFGEQVLLILMIVTSMSIDVWTIKIHGNILLYHLMTNLFK